MNQITYIVSIVGWRHIGSLHPAQQFNSSTQYHHHEDIGETLGFFTFLEHKKERETYRYRQSERFDNTGSDCSDSRPKIVLLDEPLAALDPLVVQDIQKYILKIQSSGTAILVTDHNVKNLFDITDRSYVLGEQTVIAEGTSRELLKSSKAIEHYFGSQFS